MKPGLLVRWTRKKQLKDNRAHFAAKNLQYSVDVQKDLNYIGDGSPFHTMDIYGPKGSDAVLPVILLIHGGGYVSCEKFINAGQAGFLAQEGARVVNVNYSLQPEADFIDVMRELFCALHWIEQNAAVQRFDPKGICVSGDSGGGHYALLIAAIQNSPYLQEYFGVEPLAAGLCGVAASCPMTELRTAAAGRDLTARFLRKNVLHGREKDETFIDNISIPYLLDKCEYPEVFLLTTPTDPELYAEAKRLHETFDAKGIRHEYREYLSQSPERTLGHVFNVTDPEWPESIAANRELLAWFRGRRALR
ncbi:MAG: alpha/beta hydrolase [Subdoligranulum sp.]|nr:alpha/beta hydrolase [Subdoligranulum sp.]